MSNVHVLNSVLFVSLGVNNTGLRAVEARASIGGHGFDHAVMTSRYIT